MKTESILNVAVNFVRGIIEGTAHAETFPELGYGCCADVFYRGTSEDGITWNASVYQRQCTPIVPTLYKSSAVRELQKTVDDACKSSPNLPSNFNCSKAELSNVECMKI